MRRRVLGAAAVVVIAGIVAGPGAQAAPAKETFEWQICPIHRCISQAANGSTLELKGKGMFTRHPSSASGGGTFIVRDPKGAVAERGRFVVDRLVGWKSYGGATADQIKEVRRAEGITLPKGAWGGLAVLAAHSVQNPKDRAHLKIDCVLGDRVPKRAVEGVRVTVFGEENFNKILGHSATLFVNK